MVNKWKVTALIFIILFLAETIFLGYALSLANEDIEKENECAYNICEEGELYLYYEFEGICECYDEDYNLIKQEYMS